MPTSGNIQFTVNSGYKSPFLFADTTLFETISIDRYGVAADPVPYSRGKDNAITSLLIICLIIAAVAVGKSKLFIIRNTKKFFSANDGRQRKLMANETASEVNFQLILATITCALLAIVFYFFSSEDVADIVGQPVQYWSLTLYFAAFLIYMIIRFGLYNCIGWVFFSPSQNQQWNMSLLLITALEAVALLPIVMLITYFNMDIQTAINYVIIAYIIFSTITFFKAYLIFFRRKGGFFQMILYFCALEIVPFVMLIGGLFELNNILKISN